MQKGLLNYFWKTTSNNHKFLSFTHVNRSKNFQQQQNFLNFKFNVQGHNFFQSIQNSHSKLFSSNNNDQMQFNNRNNQFSTYSKQQRSQQNNTTQKRAPIQSKDFLKKHMSQFLLRVHPDFFQNNPENQQTNQQSLQQLNRLLDLMKNDRFKDAYAHPELPKEIKLRFHVIDNSSAPSKSSLLSSSSSTNTNNTNIDVAETTIQLQPSSLSISSSTTILERVLNGVVDLFAKVGVQVDENELPRAVRDAASQRRKSNEIPKWMDAGFSDMDDMRQQVLKSLREVLNFHSKTTKNLSLEQRGERSVMPADSNIDDLTDDPNFLFQPISILFEETFTTAERENVLERFGSIREKVTKALPQEMASRWELFPVLFVHSLQQNTLPSSTTTSSTTTSISTNSFSIFDSVSSAGMLIIPFEFDVPLVCALVQKQLPLITEHHTSNRKEARSLVILSQKLMKMLRCESITFDPETMNVSDAVQILNRLGSVSSLRALASCDFDGIHLKFSKNPLVKSAEKNIRIEQNTSTLIIENTDLFSVEQFVSIVLKSTPELKKLANSNSSSSSHLRKLDSEFESLQSRFSIKNLSCSTKFLSTIELSDQIQSLRKTVERLVQECGFDLSQLHLTITNNRLFFDPVNGELFIPVNFRKEDVLKLKWNR